MAVCGIRYSTRQPSWRKARPFKAPSGQPIRANSLTYQGFRVSFHVALEITTKAGQSEIARPAHNTQRFALVSRNGASTAVIARVLYARIVPALFSVSPAHSCAVQRAGWPA